MSQSIEKFKRAFTSIYPEMNHEEWQYIVDNSECFTAHNKSILIEEGKIQKYIFFLTSGLVRGYYIDEKGEDISIRFINNEGWITHYSALISKSPSKYIFQTLEDSELVALPYSVILEGYAKFKGLEKFGRLIAESVLRTQQKRIECFQFMTAEERYLEFIQDYPELFNRVSLSHLSTYLGIKRQSLTRIRKKLAGH